MKESTLEQSTVRAIYQLLEDPKLSKKEFAQACNANKFYHETFGPPASNHRERCRSFHKRRREERKVKPHLYVRKCILSGVQVNPSETRLYNIYCEAKRNMAPTFSSPQKPPNEIKISSPPRSSGATNNGTWTQESIMGDLWVMHLGEGHIFVVHWTDARLDAGSYEICVSDDGHSLVEQKRKPSPTTAKDMLEGLFPEWAGDDTNFVVKAINSQLQADPPRQDEWEEKIIVEFSEEVMRSFYNVKGKEETSGRYHQGGMVAKLLPSFFGLLLRKRRSRVPSSSRLQARPVLLALLTLI